ncbi:MAG: acyltransferase [Pleurocapsa sp.]
MEQQKCNVTASNLNNLTLDRSDRLFFLDFLKALSIFVVVSFHAVFVPVSTYADSWVLLETVFAPFKFCVPVLLTISFFLLEKSISYRRDRSVISLIKKRLVRLAIPTLFWFSLMAVLQTIQGDFNSWLEIVETMLAGKIFTGSYFLVALFELLPLFILIRTWSESKVGVVVAVTLQSLFFLVIHVALSKNILISFIDILRVIGLPLFLYWFVYLVLGAFIYRNLDKFVRFSQTLPSIIKFWVLSLSGLLLCSEYYRLIKVSNRLVPPFDYALVSCIISAVVLFCCFISLEESQFHPGIVKAIKILSKYSLGIFCINGIISRLFLLLGSQLLADLRFNFLEILVIKLIGWMFLLGISLGLAILLKRIGLKQMVC